MQTNWYGYIGKGMARNYENTLPDTIAIITKPCSTKEEAEKEFDIANKALPKFARIETYGYSNGVIKFDEEEPIKILEGKYCRVVELT